MHYPIFFAELLHLVTVQEQQAREEEEAIKQLKLSIDTKPHFALFAY
jgi:hypothetical protein